MTFMSLWGHVSGRAEMFVCLWDIMGWRHSSMILVGIKKGEQLQTAASRGRHNSRASLLLSLVSITTTIIITMGGEGI